eukprot:TRINITY_DN1578_c0_g2_i1.p1 TRINITY_DN1578_c0_g2~~TRINITY_DN1578_c0_g2_i1.p1  ORF type:complete len:102 (-),score=4.25 TRINITY_DN1578_c0_g2_i1:504-809(-)
MHRSVNFMKVLTANESLKAMKVSNESAPNFMKVLTSICNGKQMTTELRDSTPSSFPPYTLQLGLYKMGSVKDPSCHRLTGGVLMGCSRCYIRLGQFHEWCK